MTIVCAYRAPSTGEVWIGSDSRGGGGGYVYQSVERKIARYGEWWVGLAGTGRAMQVIEEGERPHGLTPRALVDKFRAALVEAGFTKTEKEDGAPSYGQELLLARPGELYEVTGAGTITPVNPAWGFAAIGSGYAWAEGAAWALIQQKQHSPEDIVALSLRAALQFRSDCGGDLVIERVG